MTYNLAGMLADGRGGARFGPISGEREFFAKIQLRHFLALKDLCHHAKNQKNLMNRF